MSKPLPPSPASIEESVASALNEQGFLFAQVVREKICNRLPDDTDRQDAWKYVGSEYPVTATDGSQTRIDHVLQIGSSFLVIECKRANPKYKRWVFLIETEAPVRNASPCSLKQRGVTEGRRKKCTIRIMA